MEKMKWRNKMKTNSTNIISLRIKPFLSKLLKKEELTQSKVILNLLLEHYQIGKEEYKSY